jgi:hypothetical protein
LAHTLLASTYQITVKAGSTNEGTALLKTMSMSDGSLPAAVACSVERVSWRAATKVVYAWQCRFLDALNHPLSTSVVDVNCKRDCCCGMLLWRSAAA